MSKSFLFSIVFLILCHIPSFFSCFSHQSAQIHLGGFTHALRDNGPASEPQFYLASFYPLPILSTVFIAFTLSLFFPPFLLLSHFFPFFYVKVLPLFHCFSHLMSYSLIFSIGFLINLPRSTSEGGPGGIDIKILPFFHCFSHPMSYSLIFSIVFLINLPRSTSEGGPGGNRYPNVTQLPPGT